MELKPARPALDAWLAKADRVLAAARYASLSPSQASGPWDDHRTDEDTTVAELDGRLEGLLSRLAFGPGRWALIIMGSKRRYVQVLAFEDGSLVAEAVSNHYLRGRCRLSARAEYRLEGLGWERPNAESLNWRNVSYTISPDIGEVSALMLRTLRSVFGVGELELLQLSIFSSPRRGNTPASLIGPVGEPSGAQAKA